MKPGLNNMVLKQPVYMVLRLFMAGVFIFASYDKIMDPDVFAQSVYNYQILPDELVNLTALVLPWLELFLGVCLVIGFWMPGALVLINGLLLVFFGALLFNLLRGLNVECGCFGAGGQSGEDTLTLWYIVRDVVFLGCSGVLFYQVMGREKGAAV